MMEQSARKLSIFPDGSLQATAVDNAESAAARNLIINYRTVKSKQKKNLKTSTSYYSYIHNDI